ncbi:MAG: hypothetical protein IJU03_01860 [Thermoguttaceae bacterium]|nr:hypothetical protein [Thermoguttaceae bacterium]
MKVNRHARRLINAAPFVVMLVLVFVTASAIAEDVLKPGESWNPSASDQWVATDGLGRPLPSFAEVGPTRPGKYVACFYFLWNGRHGDAGPYDISKILAEHPEAKDDPNSPYWGKMYEPHHWGESIFGYYVGEDESVLRKHAQMLGDAGVDVICFDVTNQLTYPESYRPLFKVFSEMQKEGNKVPKVAFLCPFWAPNKVVRELWRDVYSKDFYKDVWFYWKGKPLILADPDYLGQAAALTSNGCSPIELGQGTVLAQKFSIDASFRDLALISPTWHENNSAVNVALKDENGKVVLEQKNLKVSDNVVYRVSSDKPLPEGVYSVELTKAEGSKVGWWSKPASKEAYSTSAGESHGVPNVTWIEATQNGEQIDRVLMISPITYDAEREQILDFFTFRPSQPDYFMGPTKPNQWSWLEAYPQHEFYNDKGEVEEMGVGVAQNAVDGKLSVLSNPRAYGRSFHNGAEPKPEDCNYEGMNFQEQWERALKTDPEIIFVTGWNEWIAGRFDINAPFHAPTPVTFVDQYNEEYSRDCEPMKGGHGDAYYYQMISNIRRFKGVSKMEDASPKAIKIDGEFNDWQDVAPKFRDTVSDPVNRDCRGWGKDMRYVNKTGRNDLVEARVSYDENFVFFYLRTKDPIQGDLSSANWLSLLVDVDDNPTTGIKGAELFVLPAAKATVKTTGKTKEMTFKVMTTSKDGLPGGIDANNVSYALGESEIEIAVPRTCFNWSDSEARKKGPTFRFKWTDGISVLGDWSDFTTKGDAAPNDRYYYRYVGR